MANNTIDTFDCPSCGGPLDLHKAAHNLVSCPFCGKNVIVPESLRPKEAPRREPAMVYIAPAHTPTDNQAPGVTAAPRWVSFLIVTVAVVTVLGIVAGVVGPLLITQQVVNQINQTGLFDRTAEPESMPVPDIGNVLAGLSATPTPAFVHEVLSFGEKGTGPGMFQDTRWVAVDPDGNVYTAEYQDGRVQKFGPDGKFIKLWNIGQDKIITDLAVGRSGVVYVVTGGDILKFDAETGEALGQVNNPQDDYFDSVAVMADGGLAAIADGETVVRMDANEAITLTIPDAFSSQTGDAELSARIAVDGLGKLYLSGSFTSAVFVYSPEGKYLNRFGSRGHTDLNFLAINDIAVDGTGRVLVADFNKIKFYTADGQFLHAVQVEGAAFGLAVDDSNRIYLASNKPKIYEFEVNK